MVISLLGIGSDTLLSDFDTAGIKYVVRTPEAGQVMNAGLLVEIAQATAPWASIAAVLVAWLRARASRKVIITLPDNKVLHVEGMGVKDVERLLPVAQAISALETKKPDSPKDAP